jgi:hypothetical protein
VRAVCARGHRVRCPSGTLAPGGGALPFSCTGTRGVCEPFVMLLPLAKPLPIQTHARCTQTHAHRAAGLGTMRSWCCCSGPCPVGPTPQVCEETPAGRTERAQGMKRGGRNGASRGKRAARGWNFGAQQVGILHLAGAGLVTPPDAHRNRFAHRFRRRDSANG